MARRQTRGRQRNEMREIEKMEEKLVTFSKRKSGIYKKASELITLCGSEVGIVTFSPAGKPYSFSHPSIESIANRFHNQNPAQNEGVDTLVESHRRLRFGELSQRHDELVHQVKADKAQGKVLKQKTEARSGEGWWEAPMDGLNLEELRQMKARMEELRRNLKSSINQRNQGATSVRGETSNQRNP
ncbi:hypothetical protein ACJRO7_021104 [Eucalyptus globulus]|uniref:MADS-box domain-containing protein n=1 Tax=Eucalyptus globulus TaxID=34317 RepID=A0ABD3KIN6_EUCGL